MNGFEALRAHIEQVPEPSDQRALSRALDAFEGIWNDGACDPARLGVVLEVAGATRSTLWSSGMEMLVQLASRYEPARDAFVAIARSRKAGSRFAAIAVIDDRLPRPVVLELLRAGLVDKSTKVRAHAFVRCNDLRATELVDDMTRVCATLAGKAREDAEWCLALTRDGYEIELRADHALITISYPWGSIVSRYVGLDDVTPERLAATIARLREEALREHEWGLKVLRQG